MRQILIWIKGTLLHRFGLVAGSMAGVALTVAFVGTLGVFLTVSNSEMTRRAIRDVPVDWQVQMTSGADRNALAAKIKQTVSPQIMEQVSYANVDGFSALTGGTVQTTGAGKVLGISSAYFAHFPAEVRRLLGSVNGALLAQQTAANLHVKVGDTLHVMRIGLSTATIKVDGIVDLPNADSLFQAVGAPAGAAPQAPPDNVLILPEQIWRTCFEPQMVIRPDSVRYQLHIRLGHTLPANPTDAYSVVTHEANNLEAQIAGSGIVGNNLSSRLLSVTEDALYAKVLFLFLGLPGVLLVISLTLTIATSSTPRRSREQALLRVRGASLTQIVRLATAEAALVGIGGVLLGLLILPVLTRISGMPTQEAWNQHTLGWILLASAIGLLLALGAVIIPAWSMARCSTVAAARSLVKPAGTPLWQRMWLDVIILLIGGLEYWRTASTGYQVILAPEGVAANSVNYEAFIAPLCLWIGGVLLSFRMVNGGLRCGRRVLTRLLAPIAHTISGLVAGSLTRQNGLITRATVLVALAASFAISTAIFDTTYNMQSRIDAELTNGADVTVTAPTATPPSARLNELRAIPGVLSAQPMQHRYAYVGSDLQDIYGIDTRYIGEVTKISDAFFGGGNARATMDALSRTPDGVLVAEETVRDFQLKQGDLLNLRLQSAHDHSYHVVPFHFVGVAREFPTAPRDSFLVANSAYLTQQTGMNAAETVLMKIKGNPVSAARNARTIVADIPGAKVTDIGSVQRAISSSLTAVDLHGLTRLELTFAVILLAGATGLILGLGLAERRRMFAILTALGAKGGQTGAFLWSEALLILTLGMLLGTVLGVGVAQVLVKMLTGVFDPPPEALAIPWLYLGMLGVSAVLSTVIAVQVVRTYSRRQVMEALRGL
ncbi:MAG: FtsX-like permease family protein [Armatimonadota bacterium]